MMKKFIFTASASAVLLFSGCTIPFMEDDLPTVSTDQASSLSKENPEELFFNFAKASGAKAMEKINESIPDKEVFIKNEGSFSISGDFDLAGTPLGGGTGDFSMKGDVKADYSDENNPILSEVIDVKVNAMGGMVKIDANGELRIIDNSIYGIVNALDYNIIGVDAKTKTMVQKFVGQWYGNTFAEIEELAGDELQGMDLKKMFAGGGKVIAIFNLIEDVLTNPESHITFGKFVEEKDGYFFFEVSPKKETYEKFAAIGLDIFLPVTGEEGDEIKKDIQKAIDELALQSIIIGYTPENPEYFKIKTLSGSISAEKTSEGCVIIGSTPDNAEESFVFNATGGNITVSFTDSEGTITPVTGTYTDNSFTFEAVDPRRDNTILAKGSFIKEGDAWSGEVTSPELPEGKVLFSEFTANANAAHGKISAQYNDNIVGNIVMDAASKKSDSVSVAKPENVKAFKTLAEEVEKEMNAQYGNTDTEILDADTLDIKETEGLETTETTETDVSGSVATASPVATSVVNTQTIPDPNNIPDVPVVKNPIVPAAVVPATNNDSDNGSLAPLLNEMAGMMSETPTEESQAKFMELANKVDAIAKEKGISEDELKVLFQEAVQQNAGQELTPVVETIK